MNTTAEIVIRIPVTLQGEGESYLGNLRGEISTMVDAITDWESMLDVTIHHRCIGIQVNETKMSDIGAQIEAGIAQRQD